MMKALSRVPSRRALLCTATVALALSAVFSAPTGVWAAEADAKRLLKAMSDYVGAQKTISFDFDASLEVVVAHSVGALVEAGHQFVARQSERHLAGAGIAETTGKGSHLQVSTHTIRTY